MNCDNDNDKIIIDKNTIFKKNVEIDNKLYVKSSTYIKEDLNVNNINSFGLISCYNNISSKGNVYISNNDDCNFLYLTNKGKIICKNIEMLGNIYIYIYKMQVKIILCKI